MEDTLLFYGHYNNRTVTRKTVDGEEQVKHIYYMGLAFVAVALISLFITAISIVLR
jgi:hypothetical protein